MNCLGFLLFKFIFKIWYEQRYFIIFLCLSENPFWIPVVLWRFYVGVYDKSPATLLWSGSIWNRRLFDWRISSSPTYELPRSTIFSISFLLGVPTSRKSFCSTTLPISARAAEAAATVCLVIQRSQSYYKYRISIV